jgi:hypothetical protein
MAAPLSIQPVYAGFVYWIRNVLYNAHKGARALKLEAGDQRPFQGRLARPGGL